MHETGKNETYEPGHLTFDCPWCGAISGVGPELVGEHFECVECGKETKLTEQNTRRAHLFEPPKDAPHHDDSPRPFHCPWCGRHTEIPPTHLGEYYDCPECHKRTKLTERTLPTTDVVPSETGTVAATGHRPAWPLALAAVVVVGAVLWALLGGGGDDETTPRDGGVAVVEEAGDAAGGPEVVDPEPATGPSPGVSPAPVEAGAEEEGRKSVGRKLAEARYAKATTASEEARSKLDAWLAAHPEVVQALEVQAVREALHARAQELLAALDTQAVGPAEVRAFNQALSAYVGEDPGRIALAESLLAALARMPVRPMRVGSWQQLNFHQPRVREVLEDQIRDGRAGLPDDYLALARAWERAAEALQAAEAELAATEGE